MARAKRVVKTQTCIVLRAICNIKRLQEKVKIKEKRKKKNWNCNHELELEAFEIVCNAAETKPNEMKRNEKFPQIERKDKKTKQSKTKQSRTCLPKSWKINFYLSEMYIGAACAGAAFYFAVYRCFLIHCNIYKIYFSFDTLRTLLVGQFERFVCMNLFLYFKRFVYSLLTLSITHR